MHRGDNSLPTHLGLGRYCCSPRVQNPRVFHALAHTREKTITFGDRLNDELSSYRFTLNPPRPAPSFGWAGGRVESVHLQRGFLACFSRKFDFFMGGNREF